MRGSYEADTVARGDGSRERDLGDVDAERSRDEREGDRGREDEEPWEERRGLPPERLLGLGAGDADAPRGLAREGGEPEPEEEGRGPGELDRRVLLRRHRERV